MSLGGTMPYQFDESECPYLIRKRSCCGEEGIDLCELNGKICVLWNAPDGAKCETKEAALAEDKEE